MKLAYFISYVPDVVKTIEFYENAFGFKRKFITPEADYGELLTGDTTLSFATHLLAESNLSKGYTKPSDLTKPLGVEIAFTTENIEEDFKKAIEAGAKEYEPLKEKPWGQKVGYLLDLNGLLIEICTPING